MKIIAGYVRVSSEEQASNTHALEQQIQRLEDYGVDKVFCDVISGSKNDRNELNEMLKLVQEGKVSKVVVTRWDRLTRNEEGYQYLKSVFRESDTALYILDQGEIDLVTAAGQLSSDVQVLMAVHERRLLQERVRHGHAHRRKRLAACGRTPFAYVVKDEKYQLDRKPIVCLIELRPDNYLELYHESDVNKLPGISKSDIAKELIKTFLRTRNAN